MNLVIDTWKLVKGHGKSIGIYNLTKTLVRYLGEENIRQGSPHNIIVLGNAYNRTDMEKEGVTFILVPGNPLSRAAYVYWELFRVVSYAKRFKADRILFPRGYRPLIYSGKDTIIVHDLIPFWYDQHFPGYLGRIENAYIMNRLKASIAHADRVITISDYSRKAIDEMVPGSASRVCRIYNGLNDMDLPAGDARNPDAGSYIVSVTSAMPHKNAKGIAAAYNRYCAVCEEKGIKPLSLTVIGIPDVQSFVEEGILSRSAARSVTCHAYIENYADMCRLIRDAKVFLFLSLIEGFGFPPLEAMQLGTPVVCSDRTSLPEVVGDAGLLVDPDNADSVADSLLLVQTRQDLADDLVRKGRRNTERFTWQSRTKEYWDELFRDS